MNKNNLQNQNLNTVGVDASHACDICNSHRSNSYPNIDPHSKGITIIALIITIIVMLILVAVSINIAINGGIFTTAKRGAKETEEAKNAEQELASGRVKIDGVWYDSIEDYVGGKASEDQNESNIKFAYEPKEWTNGVVKVKIEAQGIVGTLQYSTDRVTWTNYTEEIEVTDNGTTIYARELNNTKEEKIVIENIDKEAPTITKALSSPSQTTSSIKVEIGVTDSVSGISEIKWYYKLKTASDYELLTTDTYADKNRIEAGSKTVNAVKEIPGLEKDTTYNIYVEIYDVVGHKKTSDVIEVQTIASLLGKSATIDGVKYKVLYEAGEQGENVQLISVNVLEPNNIYLGSEDGQIDWANANVITEADLDNNGTLDDAEKAIYSYNHAIETLNKKCESLVDTTNPDIVSVRSVGSNPTNPNSENTTLYTSDFLANNPTNESGKYNGIGKSTDQNYLTDYNRMVELGISKAENSQQCWMPARYIKGATDSNKTVNYYIYDISVEGYLITTTILQVNVNGAFGASIYGIGGSCGVRPVVSLKSDAISKYLD